jgi:mitochondrial cardiolipin hydrolase
VPLVSGIDPASGSALVLDVILAMTKELFMNKPASLYPERLRAILSETLDDQMLSRSEKKALQQIVEEVAPDGQQLAAFRSVAFELARKHLDNSKKTKNIIDWLEAVTKVLTARERESKGPSSRAYFSPGQACMHRIINLLETSQKTADICVFTITDNRISEAIAACHARGVALRVISDDDKSFDRGSDIQKLRERGVAVRVDNSPAHMHHKFAVFDDELLLTGSYNWTRSAARENLENLIVTNDGRLTRAFSEHFNSLWEKL